MEGFHRKVVGTGIVDDELLCKVIQRVEVVARIEALLILTVAALDFAVVPRRGNPYSMIYYSRFIKGVFKHSFVIFRILYSQRHSKFSAVIRLYFSYRERAFLY